jgi:hypothetical protein
MKTAQFTNFTDQEFIGYWDGKAKKFAPGQSLYMPDYLAVHFAKHLTNQELLRTDKDGSLIHKDGDKFTSPKNPKDAPIFMKLFNQAYTPDLSEEEDLGDKKDDVDTLIASANKNREEKLADETVQESGKEETPTAPQDSSQPQTVLPPDYSEKGDDSEDSFKGKPVEDGK